MSNPRRIERERVLELLYEAAGKAQPVDDVLRDLPVPPTPFVGMRVRGVATSEADLDARISQHLQNWDLDRVALLDRIVLRIGTWELVNAPDVPAAVVISEAVELAKKFSTDESGKFVNGVLAAIAAAS